MAYTKTNWVNDSVPAINAGNLNKIEQGIYEAHQKTDTIGDLSNLTTPVTSSLVGAINSIVESGSNANGSYIKYADGTMICMKEVSFTVDITTAWGSMYESTPASIGNYAQEFLATPFIYVTNVARDVFVESIKNTTKTAFGTIGFATPTSYTNVPLKLDFLAIGRWK